MSLVADLSALEAIIREMGGENHDALHMLAHIQRRAALAPSTGTPDERTREDRAEDLRALASREREP